MTPAQVEVARQLAALPGWRWEEGMRVWGGGRIVLGGPFGGVPDITDPATAGVLLGRLRAVAPRVTVSFVDPAAYVLPCDPVQVRVGEGRYYGSCLGEAVARALVALGRCS